MPYELKQQKDKKYKVKKKQRGRPKYFSKMSLPYKRALAQMFALRINAK